MRTPGAAGSAFRRALQALLASVVLHAGLAVNPTGRRTAQVKPDGGVFGAHQHLDQRGGGAALLRREDAPEHRKGIYARVMAELGGSDEEESGAGDDSGAASAEEDDRAEDSDGDDLEDIRRRALGGRGSSAVLASSENEPTEQTFDCDEGAANWVQGWSSWKKAYCCTMKGRGCEAWSLLTNGYCSPIGTALNTTNDFGAGQGKEGCKDSCDMTSLCNYVVYNEPSGECSMSTQPIAPTTCNSDQRYWSYWKPQSQAAPATTTPSTMVATTTDPPTTTEKTVDAGIPDYEEPSTTLPLFFHSTSTQPQPPTGKLPPGGLAPLGGPGGQPPTGKLPPGGLAPLGGPGGQVGGWSGGVPSFVPAAELR